MAPEAPARSRGTAGDSGGVPQETISCTPCDSTTETACSLPPDQEDACECKSTALPTNACAEAPQRAQVETIQSGSLPKKAPRGKKTIPAAAMSKEGGAAQKRRAAAAAAKTALLSGQGDKAPLPEEIVLQYPLDQLTCPVCEEPKKQYAKHSTLVTHITRYHAPVCYLCEQCSSKFKNLLALKKHKTSGCTTSPPSDLPPSQAHPKPHLWSNSLLTLIKHHQYHLLALFA
ncbi:uncharacterized protein LOC121920683 [Sceloporus undulatus]|uniref:uncharacterized protein LOC121920683 n=1 Tax=Sceloporus undulatus TaxID=8520 RepID=UPI001C4BBC18|nr:uncharacterized protein LOC121920683 [Sceloporus undulatus]